MDEPLNPSSAAEPDLIAVEAVPIEVVTAVPPPRLWPTIVVGVTVIPVSIFVNGIAIVAGMAASGVFQARMKPSDISEWLVQVAESPAGLLLLIVPGQLVFLAAAIIPAMFSRTSFRLRLGLTNGRCPWWLYLLLMAATPLFALLGAIPVMSLMEEPSEHLKLVYAMIADAQGGTALLVFFLICVMPAVIEELLFRGYLQRRCLQRWHPFLVILVTSLLFAAAHVDPMHAAAVFPLGLWMGFVAWQTGSILPAIACHFFNNLLSVVEVWTFGDPFQSEVALDASTLVTLGISATAFAATMIVFRKDRSRGKEFA